MKMRILLAAVFLASFSAFAANSPWESTLQSVESTFDKIYAFKGYKAERFGWSGPRLMNQTRQGLDRLGRDPDLYEARDILGRFYESTRDIHVSARYFIRKDISRSYLPLRIRSASDGKFYVVEVNREKIPPGAFSINQGDEVLSFGGESVAKARSILVPRFFAQPRTQIARAEQFLTDRYDVLGHELPKGNIALVIRSQSTRETASFEIPWIQVARPPSARRATRKRMRGLALDTTAVSTPLNPKRRFAGAEENPVANYALFGAKRPFFRDLGSVVWRTEPTDPLYAYEFRLPNGKLAGLVRVGTYFPKDIYSKVTPFFAELMSRFARDGISVLVFDQTNNAGGSLLYAMDMMRSLIAKPVRTPLQVEWIVNPTHFEVSQPWAKLRDLAQSALTDPAAFETFQKTLYVDKIVNEEFLRNFVVHANKMLATIPTGRRLMAPSPFEGQEWIRPVEGDKYLGPILMLNNELSISAADLSPALFADLGRASFFGERTAGAGAYQNGFMAPEENAFSLWYSTISFGKINHRNGKPVENNGTTPHFPYRVTGSDLRSGMSGYRNAVIRAALAVSRRGH